MLNLSNICSYIGRGKNLPSIFKYNKETTYILRYSDVENNGSVILPDNISITVDDKIIFQDLIYTEKNDIIFPELFRNNLELKYLKDNCKDKTAYSNKMIFIRVNPLLYNPLFLYNLLSTQKYKDKISEEIYKPSKGYKDVNQIRLESLRSFEIPFVSLEKQEEILKKHKAFQKQIYNLENDLCTLYDI